MRITVASGKGGTGKTTLAVNLALHLSNLGESVVLADCDVEEPNVALFLPVEWEGGTEAVLPVPVVDQNLCDLCRRCEEACLFNAIAILGEKVLVYNELCHGCGACLLVCPTGALYETTRTVGTVRNGKVGQLRIVEGELNIGEAMAPPLIRQVKRGISGGEDTAWEIIDAPPGTSCPTITSMMDSDYVLLVGEPTPFGYHDFKLTVETMKRVGIPYGAFINRDGMGGGELEAYCVEKNIPILGRMPDSLEIAKAYSKGLPVIEALPEFVSIFDDLANRLREVVPS